MLSASRRYLLALGLLLVGVAFALAQRWLLAPAPPAIPTREGLTPLAGSAAAQGIPAFPDLAFTYFLDVEGWYRITPYETVVRSAIDLTADSNEALSAALPSALGGWLQVGSDTFFGDDPSVVEYLGNPTVALSRTYQDGSGHFLTLSLVGNRGDESYLIFSHTPETCLPGRLWQITDRRRESALLDDRPMYAQYLLTEYPATGDRQIALYWYLWDTPERDSRQGVLSMRVYVTVAQGESETAALDRAWGFIRGLFPSTVPWDRF